MKGECRRYPKQSISDTDNIVNEFTGETGKIYTDIYYEFPKMDYSEWCGEWKEEIESYNKRTDEKNYYTRACKNCRYFKPIVDK